MATIRNNVVWATNSAELAAELKKGLDTVVATEAATQKLVQTLSGDRLVAAANKYTAAVLQMGGAAGLMAGAEKLTASEKERINSLLDKAIQKYTLLGRTAPTAMLELYEATKKAGDSTSGWLGLLSEMGHSFVARVAEGVLLRDAIREIISKVQDLATWLPQIALKGATVADVEENFQRLTVQAGLLGSTLLGTLRAGTRNTITDFELMKTVNKDLAAGLNLTEKQFGVLSTGAFALAKATGGDVKQAFDTMNDAMLTGRTRSLAELTGKIQTTDAEEKFAAAMKHSANQLTDTGKLEAARAAILDAVGAATERLGEQTDGLGERVAQLSTAWSNFEEDLGKTIATSPVLEAAMSGVKDAIVSAFGDTPQAAVKAVASTVDDAIVTLVSLGSTGVQVAGFIAKEFIATEKVVGDFIQILDGVRLAFLYTNLEIGKARSVTTGIFDKTLRSQIDSTDEAIGKLLVTMKARGDRLQEDDKQQSAIDATTAKYVATLTALSDKVKAARDHAQNFVGPLNDMSDAHDRAGTAAKKQGDALFKLSAEEIAAAKKFAEAMAELKSSGDGWQGTLDTIDGSVVESVKSYLQAGVSATALATVYRLTAAQVKAVESSLRSEKDMLELVRSIEKTALVESLKEYDKWAAGVSKAADDVGKHIVDGAVEINTAQKEIADINAKQGLSTWDYQIVKIQEWATSAKGAFKGTAEQAKVYYDLIDKEASAKIALIDSDWETLKVNSTATLQRTADVAAATYDYMLDHADEFSAGTIEKFKKIAEAAQDAAEGTQHAWINAFVRIGEAIPGLVQQAFTGGGGLAGAARASGALVGSELGKGLVTHLTEEAPEFMGSALGKVFGAAIPAIGALAGPLISAIIKLFDHLGDDIARDAGEKFGAKFSEGTTKAITDDVHSGMTEVAAELNNLDKIIADMGGITAQNIDRVTARFHDLFSMLQTGQLTAAQVNKQLTAGFPALAAAATDATGRWSDGLKEIIRLDRQAGIGTQAITDALKAQGVTLGTSFNAAAAALVDDKDSLASLGAQAVRTFAIMVASGSTTAEAMAAISPGLASLRQSFADLGIDVEDVGLKSLLMQDSINKGNPQLIAGINGLASEFVALDNLGAMNVDQLSAMEAQGMAMYTRLQAGVAALGGTTKDALEPMQGFLHQAVIEAQALGVPLDANTQMLIDQSKDAGIWQDAITPQDKLLGGMQSLIDKVSELIDRLNGIPKKVDTTVTTTFDTNGAPVGPDNNNFNDNYAASGGLVRAGRVVPFALGGVVPEYFGDGGISRWSFRPIGTDTVPAMLTPGELILNAAQQDNLARLIPDGLQSSSPWEAFTSRIADRQALSVPSLPTPQLSARDSAGGDLRVVLQLDGRIITEQVIRNVQLNKDGSYTKARGALGLSS